MLSKNEGDFIFDYLLNYYFSQVAIFIRWRLKSQGWWKFPEPRGIMILQMIPSKQILEQTARNEIKNRSFKIAIGVEMALHYDTSPVNYTTRAINLTINTDTYFLINIIYL